MEDKKMVTLAEVKDILSERQNNGEPTAEQKLALDHAQKFSRVDSKKAKKLVKELTELGFVSEVNAVKIADILPSTADDVRLVFSKERASVEKKDIEKVLSVVEKYL
ncbi:MAG: RNA polymerase Rpb4 family protein [Thermoplasmatota archaeon]|nr:RNA polymerase Rpb4 family protein [Candidatus Thermoplasmatota archaeon]MBU1914097.1 RNA polymerase Rpb4 family protein [Candidatus Thermoplasmatota archaeon]